MFSRSIWLLNLASVFAEVFYVMYATSLQKIFTEIKKLKTVFNFDVFCLLQEL